MIMMTSCIVAISGASGSVYGLRLVEELLRTVEEVHLIVSQDAFLVMKLETGLSLCGDTEADTGEMLRTHFSSKKIRFYSEDNIAAPVSSGSFRTDGMFVLPCSMKTLAGIASGYANNLIERAADVTLKEGRKLIICPREMPLNAIHLENMLKLARIGVTIAPPMPAFYQRPESIEEMVDFVIGKVLDCAGLSHALFRRWQ